FPLLFFSFASQLFRKKLPELKAAIAVLPMDLGKSATPALQNMKAWISSRIFPVSSVSLSTPNSGPTLLQGMTVTTLAPALTTWYGTPFGPQVEIGASAFP